MEIIVAGLVIPVSRVGGMLTVAFGDPFNVSAVEELRSISKLDIVPVVAPERTSTTCWERFRGKTRFAGRDDRGSHRQEVEVSKEQKWKPRRPTWKSRRSARLSSRREQHHGGAPCASKASDIHLEPMEKNVLLRYRIEAFSTTTPAREIDVRRDRVATQNPFAPEYCRAPRSARRSVPKCSRRRRNAMSA